MSVGHDPKFAKLPKWARDHIYLLEGKLREQEHQNRVLRGSGGFEGTDVFVSRGTDSIPLPKGARIRFKTGDRFDEYLEVGFNLPKSLSGLANRPKALYVTAGSGATVVVPSARNAIHVVQESY